MPHIQELPPESALPLLIAFSHPSAERAVAVFAEELRAEPRLFGTAPPKLRSTTLKDLISVDGIRLGVMIGGRVIGMVRVDTDGSALVAVVPAWRGKGIGRQLLEAAVRRAPDQGHQRVIVHCSRRSPALVHIAQSAGATVIDCGDGRIDLIFSIERVNRIA